MCFEYASDLPRVGTAAGSAEGFLTTPVAVDAAPHGATPATTPRDGRRAEYAAAVARADPRRTATCVAEALSAEQLPEQVRVRRAKLDRLRAEGIEPYPVDVPAHPHAGPGAGGGRRRCRRTPRPGDGSRSSAGCMLKRDLGKLGFADAARRQRRPAGDGRRASDVGAELLDLLAARHRPRRPRRRDRRGGHHAQRASCRSAPSRSR